MAFPGGVVPADVVLPIWSEIDYAANGKPFSDAVYGGSFPMRKAGKLSVKARTRKDVVQQDQNDMYDVMLDAELYGNSTAVLQTMWLLHRYGPNNIRLKDELGKFWNFVNNDAGLITQGDATGSTLLSNMFQFEVGDVERSIKSKWEGGMYLAEYFWALNNASSGATGGSGGATIPDIATMNYDPNNVAAPGILDVLVDDGTNNFSVGMLEVGSKLTLDFHEQGMTQPRHQKIPGWVDVKAEIVMWQSAFDELKWLFGNQNKDITTTFVLAPAGVNGAGGETANFQIICNNAVKLSHDYEADETKNLVKVAFNGRVRGAANVAFDLMANTLTLTRQAYV